MKPLLKYTGGKSSEISIVKPYFPKDIARFIEPFAGGASFYFDLEHEASIINDLNSELICLYRTIQDKNLWSDFHDEYKIFEGLKSAINIASTKTEEKTFIAGLNLINDPFWSKIFHREYSAKIKLIHRLKGQISYSDERKHLTTALYSSLFYWYRKIYNDNKDKFNAVHIFSFFVMRELAYSGMFRVNSSGLFNVPYGGVSYNKKDLGKKIDYCESLAEKTFFKNTTIESLDFEDLFDKYNYFNEDDFILLDPPYIEVFNEYLQEGFSEKDHIRLRDVLLKTKARILLLVNNTDLMRALYKKDFNITSYPKKYSVNIKNRNEQETTHLIITNYKI